MSDLAGFSGGECRKAYNALVNNVVSRTGTEAALIDALLRDSDVTSSSVELLDSARWNAIALGAVVASEIDGLPCDRSPAYRNVIDAAHIGLSQGLRTGANVSLYEQMVARIVVLTGENAYVVKRAIDGIGLPFGWQATPEGREKAERLTLARFLAAEATLH